MAEMPASIASAGNPIAGNRNSITAGPPGPEGNWDLVGTSSQKS